MMRQIIICRHVFYPDEIETVQPVKMNVLGSYRFGVHMRETEYRAYFQNIDHIFKNEFEAHVVRALLMAKVGAV